MSEEVSSDFKTKHSQVDYQQTIWYTDTPFYLDTPVCTDTQFNQ